MSAARLAAEAAFAAAPCPPAAQPVAAQVILRRSRLAGAPEPVVDERPPEAPAPGDKGARVFRVHTAPSETPAAPAAPVAAEAPLPAVVPRTRKVRADKRPGPVVVVMQAAAAPAPPPPAPPAARLEDLLVELNRAGQVLEMAERAQAFRIEPDDSARAWQQLAQKIERLKQSLQKPAR